MNNPVTVDDAEIKIGNHVILRGQTRIFSYSVGRLYDFTELAMPICVVRAKEPGPIVLLTGSIHGDEIIGPEIIKRFLRHKRLRLTKGTVIAIPIVNVFGYNSQSRYLPDRRDLNRCFPGSPQGSLASIMAHTIVKEFLHKCTYGIDFHSAAIHRGNLPQIRANLEFDPEMIPLCHAFGAPVILNAKNREGSIRSAAQSRGVKMIVYEGGEALRVEERSVKHAVTGILNVLEFIGMIDKDGISRKIEQSYIAQSSYWLRTPQSGSIRMLRGLGDKVEAGAKLAIVSDVFGYHAQTIEAKTSGIIIGDNRIPLVNKGDAVFHVATFENEEVIQQLADKHSELIDNQM